MQFPGQPQDPIPTASPADNPSFAAPSPGVAGAWGGERDWKDVPYDRSIILGLTPQATAISRAPRPDRIASRVVPAAQASRRFFGRSVVSEGDGGSRNARRGLGMRVLHSGTGDGAECLLHGQTPFDRRPRLVVRPRLFRRRRRRRPDRTKRDSLLTRIGSPRRI
jgi:hypothetical protein